MPETTEMSKGRNIFSTILIFIPGIALVASSLMIFAHVPSVVAQMVTLGFDGPRLLLIAVLELVSATLFLLPKTRSVGLLLVSAYLGGAIATHVGHGQSPVPPVALLTLIWMGTYYVIRWCSGACRGDDRRMRTDDTMGNLWGTTWLVVAIYVPLMMVSLGLTVWQLLSRRHENLSA